MSNFDFRVEATKKRGYYYRIVSTRNGQPVLVSETYKTKWGVRRAAKRFAAVNHLEYREAF